MLHWSAAAALGITATATTAADSARPTRNATLLPSIGATYAADRALSTRAKMTGHVPGRNDRARRIRAAPRVGAGRGHSRSGRRGRRGRLLDAFPAPLSRADRRGGVDREQRRGDRGL